MTLYQQSGGTDHGVVGFEQGRSRQFLVFPKPLKPFLGQRVVGIKYELLEEAPVSKKEPAKKETVKQPEEQPTEPAPATKNHRTSKRAERQMPAVVSKTDTTKTGETTEGEENKFEQDSGKLDSEDKVVKFRAAEPEKRPVAESGEINAIKNRVREAMDALEQGKQVVAFNLLKRILDGD